MPITTTRLAAPVAGLAALLPVGATTFSQILSFSGGTNGLVGLVRGGGVKGLSFGYRVKAARRGPVRELTAVDLIEVSLVAQPMQPLFHVTRSRTAWVE